MHPLLESAWLKVNRANSHLKRLDAQVEAFFERQRDAVAPYLDRKSGEIVFWAHRTLEKPPAEFYPIIGDTLFNYRSALDHLMWALVIVSKGTPHEGVTQWPIFGSADDFFERRNRRRWEGVSDRVRAMLERDQPYYGGNPVQGEILTYLNDLHNVDKHRHPNLATSIFAGFFTSEWIGMQKLRAINQAAIMYTGRVEQGTILARIPREYVNVEFHPSFDIVFTETTAAPDQKVRLVLGGIDDVVHDILEQYERLFLYNDPTALGRHWNDLHHFWDG